MSISKIILFDIDGTIILTKGAGRRVLEEAINHVFGRDLDASTIRFSGKTDPQIVREILEANGIIEPELSKARSAILERYANNFSIEELMPTLEVLPGVKDLISLLSQNPTIKIGLLTGNLEATSWLKIDAASIDRSFFEIGGYGSDSEDRYSIPAIVLKKAQNHFEEDLAGKQLVIIGDTEHDIKCGKSISAKSIGVATGHYTLEELKSHNPDLAYADLSDAKKVYADIVAL